MAVPKTVVREAPEWELKPEGFAANDFIEPLGLGNRNPNRAGSLTTYDTGTGTREIYNPGATYYSNDPLKGSVIGKAGLVLDPLGIYDVPQIKTDIERLDPNYLNDFAANAARTNAMRSIGLEEELDPTTAQARRTAMEQFLAGIEGGQVGDEVIDALMAQFGANTDIGVPELQESQLLNEARQNAMNDLELGGSLSQEMRNMIARESAGRASGVGVLGGQIGRDISARDLGLNSMNLYNQRLDRASALGAAEEATNLSQQGLKANISAANRAFQQQNLMQMGQQISGLRQQEFANRFGAAEFTQGIERPVAGVDPGDLASYIVSDVNQRNQIVNQANIAQLNAAQGAKASQNALLGDVMGMFGGMMGCWIARGVYGEHNAKWRMFRYWLFNDAPLWFFDWYMVNGERVGADVRRDAGVKAKWKRLMDGVLAKIVKNGTVNNKPILLAFAERYKA